MGIQDPSEEIVNLLIGRKSDKMKQHRIVSIVGPGSSGKTTLANQVYQKINGQFSCKSFVSVSQNCNMNSLLWELLSEIQSSCGISDNNHHLASSYSNQQLIDRLRSLLTEKAYLIVIDDVWCQSDWETIQCVLPRKSLSHCPKPGAPPPTEAAALRGQSTQSPALPYISGGRQSPTEPPRSSHLLPQPIVTTESPSGCSSRACPELCKLSCSPPERVMSKLGTR